MPYSAPPGTRLAYDLDGTVGLITKNTGKSIEVVEIANTALAAMNDERMGAMSTLLTGSTIYVSTSLWLNPAWGGVSYYSGAAENFGIFFLFPTPTQLQGIFLYAVGSNGPDNYGGYSVGHWSMDVFTSTDTTNGLDGTWTQLIVRIDSLGVAALTAATSVFASPRVNVDGSGDSARGGTYLSSANDNYRRNFNADGVGIVEVAGAATRHLKGIRFQPGGRRVIGDSDTSNVLFKIHLYGQPDTDALTQRLDIWQVSSDLRASAGYLDWGDTPLGSTADKSFRVKNVSPTLTAHTITVDILPALATTIPSPDSMMLLSLDGGATWTATVEIATLSPGAISGTILIRRTTPANAALSNWSPRLSVETLSWT